MPVTVTTLAVTCGQLILNRSESRWSEDFESLLDLSNVRDSGPCFELHVCQCFELSEMAPLIILNQSQMSLHKHSQACSSALPRVTVQEADFTGREA